MINALPPDLLLLIFSKLDWASKRGSVFLVCRRWAALCAQPSGVGRRVKLDLSWEVRQWLGGIFGSLTCPPAAECQPAACVDIRRGGGEGLAERCRSRGRGQPWGCDLPFRPQSHCPLPLQAACLHCMRCAAAGLAASYKCAF